MGNNKLKPIRMEFETVWMPHTLEDVDFDSRFLETSHVNFNTKKVCTRTILPDDIPYRDLVRFIGRKTKITIETIP